MASKNSEHRQFQDSGLIQAAGGRCSCTGQCGHNHNWMSNHVALRCRAPHGVNVVRKLDNPSCWRNAPLQGFLSSKDKDKDMQGPRTHEQGRFVTRGIATDFAFAELFDVQRISQVWLSGVRVRSGKNSRIAMCQFCARKCAELRQGK